MKIVVTLVVLNVLVLFGVIGGAAVVADRLGTQQEGTRQIRAAELATIVPRYRADQKALKEHWLFATVDGPDASSVLQARVPFRPGPDLSSRTLGVPADVVDALKTRSVEWASSASPLDLTGLDLGWLAELPRFGVWDLEAKGSPMNILRTNWPDQRFPDFSVLFPVQKARLLQGLARGDLPAAFAETRSLARLCASTELYVGTVAAAAMVKVEGQFIEALQARGIDPGVPEPATVALGEQLIRATWAAPAAFQVLPFIEGLEDDVVVARCAGLSEGLGSADFMRPMLGDQEAARYARLDALLTSSRCRLKNLRAAWQEQTERPSHEVLSLVCDGGEFAASDLPEPCKSPRLWTLLPFTRTAAGRLFEIDGKPEWFRHYAASTTPAPAPVP